MAHMYMLLYPTIVLGLSDVFQAGYGELISLATLGYIAFGAGALPAGWLADRWNAHHMMTLFFVGTGLASIATGFSNSLTQLAIGLTTIGVFASIYHPVGAALLAAAVKRFGKAFGVHGMSGNLGSAAAPFIAGMLVAALNWRMAFIIPGIAGVGVGIVYYLSNRTQYLVREKKNDGQKPSLREIKALIAQVDPLLRRVFIFLGIATLATGLIYQTTSVSLPKLFAEHLDSDQMSLIGIGGWVSLVYALAAVAQVIVGHWADVLPLRRLYFYLFLLQAPLLALISYVSGSMMITVATLMVFLNAGAIPVGDAVIARYSHKEWRSSIYALKFIIALGVSSLAIPSVAWTHSIFGDLTPLFLTLSGTALITAISCMIFVQQRNH